MHIDMRPNDWKQNNILLSLNDTIWYCIVYPYNIHDGNIGFCCKWGYTKYKTKTIEGLSSGFYSKTNLLICVFQKLGEFKH